MHTKIQTLDGLFFHEVADSVVAIVTKEIACFRLPPLFYQQSDTLCNRRLI